MAPSIGHDAVTEWFNEKLHESHGAVFAVTRSQYSCTTPVGDYGPA